MRTLQIMTSVNRVTTFDEEFEEIIGKMKKYLITNHLRMIEFTYTDKWHFKMNLPEKEFQKWLAQEKMQITIQENSKR